MEVKVLCDCGQKYAFDVEPVEGQMPVSVNCPSCGVDGTPAANSVLTQTIAADPVAKPASVRIGHSAPPTVRVSLPHKPSLSASPSLPVPEAAPAPAQPQSKLTEGPRIAPVQYMADKPPGLIPVANMGLGILGAILGAGVGSGLRYAFIHWSQFDLPMSELGVGAATGLGARLLFRGTDNSLGAVAAIVTLLVVGIPIFLSGLIGIWLSIVSLFISVLIAYKIAS